MDNLFFGNFMGTAIPLGNLLTATISATYTFLLPIKYLKETKKLKINSNIKLSGQIFKTDFLFRNLFGKKTQSG